jgi:hypothetical protein
VRGRGFKASSTNYDIEWIAFNLIQIESNPSPAQAGNIAVALNRVNQIERKIIYYQ